LKSSPPGNVPARLVNLSVPPQVTLPRPRTLSLVPAVLFNSMNVVPASESVLLMVSAPMDAPGE